MVTDARERTVWFNYDLAQPDPYPANLGNAGLLSQIKLGTDSSGNGGQVFANLYYDAFGRLAAVQGGNQVGIHYAYGTSGELVEVRHAGDFWPETFTYHCCGQIDKWRKQDLRSVRFEYDLNGQLTDIFLSGSPDPSYQFTYDNAGRLLTLKDPTTPTNQPSTWAYDYTTGRLSQSQTRLPIGGYTWTYQYLPSGEVSQATLTYPNQSSTVWNYEYDDAGRLTTIKRNNQTLATYSYDGAGRLIGQSVAPLSLSTSIQYADSQSVGAVGLLTHTRNGQTVAGFDYRGDPNSPNRADWGYYADGTLHRASESLAGSTRQWEWDYHPDGSLQYEKLNSNQTDFTYDLGGNLTAWGEETGWYYWFNQLTWIPDRLWHYTYTRNGERSRWWTGASQQELEGDVNRDGQVDDADLLLVLFMYGQSCNGCPEDLNTDGMVDEGDLLIVLFNFGLQIGSHLSWEYRYDVWGNLEQAESAAVGLYQAAYDGFGRRAWQEIKGVRTYFVYDGDTIVAELDTNGNPVVEYAWGLLGPIARLDLTNPSNTRYYILDALGHTRLLLDNTGNVTDTYVYDAWGNLLKGSEFNTPNPFTWNGAYGYEWIEFTGLFHVGAREYDPRTARWLQRDPIGVGGGHPNVYLYCGNDPLNHTDPSGLDDDPDEWVWIGQPGSKEAVEKGGASHTGQRYLQVVNQGATATKEFAATAASFYPGMALIEAIYGRDCSGQQLSNQQRFELLLLAILLPGGQSGGKLLTKIVGKLSFSSQQLQRKFKHAGAFDVLGNYSKANAAKFETALQQHCGASTTILIQGTYRGTQQVYHLYNPTTGLNAMFDLQGNWISGWRLSQDQIDNLLRSGNIQ
jgi:RHS repeat-associated protein